MKKFSMVERLEQLDSSGLKREFWERSNKNSWELFSLESQEIAELDKLYALESAEAKEIFQPEILETKKNIDRELNAEATRVFSRVRLENLKWIAEKVITKYWSQCQELVNAYNQIKNSLTTNTKDKLKVVQFILAAFCTWCQCEEDLKWYVNKVGKPWWLDGYIWVNSWRLFYLASGHLAWEWINITTTGKPNMGVLNEIGNFANNSEVIPAESFETLNFTAAWVDSLVFEVSKTAPFALKEWQGLEPVGRDGKSFSKKVNWKGEWWIEYNTSATTIQDAWNATFYAGARDNPVDTDQKTIDTNMSNLVISWINSDYEKTTTTNTITGTITNPMTNATYETKVTWPSAVTVTKNGNAFSFDQKDLANWAYTITITGTLNWKSRTKEVKFTIKDKVTTSPVDTTPETTTNNLPEGLSKLKANANGIVSGLDPERDYRIKTPRAKSRRKMSDLERGSAFVDNTKIALKKNPPENEIFVVNRKKQQSETGATSLIIEQADNTWTQLDWLPSVIVSWAYENELNTRKNNFKKFPIINVDWYPDKKEWIEIKTFIDEYIINQIVNDEQIKLDYKITKTQTIITNLLNQPNPRWKLPSSINPDWLIVFWGSKINTKTFRWKEKKNQRNEYYQYQSLMQVYQNQVIHHINKTNWWVYQIELQKPNFDITENNTLDAQRNTFSEVDLSENEARGKLNQRYLDYNNNIKILWEIISKDDQAKEFLEKKQYWNDNNARLDKEKDRINYMKQRIQVEWNLLLYGKKIAYLQWWKWDENDKPISSTEAISRIKKLKKDADEFIKTYNDSELWDFINKPSEDISKPSLIDVATIYGVGLDGAINDKIKNPDLNSISTSLVNAQQEIRRIDLDIARQTSIQNNLQPWEPLYINNYNNAQKTIDLLLKEKTAQEKIILDKNIEFWESIKWLPSIAKSFYESLQITKNQRSAIITPLKESKNNTSTIKNNDVTETYNSKQTTLPGKVESNTVHISNKELWKRHLEEAWNRQTSLKEYIWIHQDKIDEALKEIQTQQAKTSKGEVPDLKIISDKQKVIEDNHNDMQKKIVEYNSLFYQSAVAIQEDLFSEKEEIDTYLLESTENLRHLQDHEKHLKVSIDNRISQFNSIKSKIKTLVLTGLDDRNLWIKYNEPEIDNLTNQAKKIYKELTWKEDLFNREKIHSQQDLTFDAIKNNSITGSLIKTYEDTKNLSSKEALRNIKWEKYSEYQQIRIDIIWLKAQKDMLDANVINWNKYKIEVLQEQLKTNLTEIQSLEQQNTSYEIEQNTATAKRSSELSARIGNNKARISLLGAENIRLKWQIDKLWDSYTSWTLIWDASIKLKEISSKLKSLEDKKTNLNWEITANKTVLTKTSYTYNNTSAPTDTFILTPDKTIEYKPYSK